MELVPVLFCPERCGLSDLYQDLVHHPNGLGPLYPDPFGRKSPLHSNFTDDHTAKSQVVEPGGPMTYPTLQLALSPKNKDHVKIQAYLDSVENKRHGFKSRILEKALLMYIEHQEVRGEDSPKFWTPLKGHEDQTIVLDASQGDT